jgi:hypothetical protein
VVLGLCPSLSTTGDFNQQDDHWPPCGGSWASGQPVVVA